MAGRVWLIDASALIETKQRVAVGVQWEFFKALEGMVEGQSLAMPRQVINELTDVRWPDAPGAWAGGMRSKLTTAFIDAPLALVGVVLDLTPKLLEEDASGEPADPYLVAMALAFAETGEYDPVIVTEDLVDRLPLKMSLRTAAMEHGVDCCTLREFATEVGFECRRGPGDPDEDEGS